MNSKMNCPGKLGNPKKNQQRYNNSASSQRTRILEHFSKCPRLSTMEARDNFGILHPCGRIMELRRRGYRINTVWIKTPDRNGVFHRIGLYVFQGKNKEVSHESV